MICDLKSNVHDPVTIAEDDNALRVICKQCKHQFVIRKDPFKKVPEMREYAKIFKRDILQPKDRLFHKVYPQYLII